MKPTFKVLIVSAGPVWASWPAKIVWLQAFFTPICNIEFDIKETDLAVPFVEFLPTNTSYEVLQGLTSYVDPDWYRLHITPLAASYDASLLVCPLGVWPLMDCVRGVTTQGTGRPVPCEIGAGENEAVYAGTPAVELFATAEHYGAHELCHALFELAGIPPTGDTTHYWDFQEHNLAGVLSDIKFRPTMENPDVLEADWSKPTNAIHNVRVLCDLAGLTVAQKDLICACIYVESAFETQIEGRPNTNGTHDWGICQFNDGSLRGIPLWIGPGAYFTSVAEVLANPAKCVGEMIALFKLGHIGWWVSYSSGLYKAQLLPNSGMRQLLAAYNSTLK